MTDREDALAKAREALSAAIHDTPGWSKRCQEALSALSAPPSQSESDDGPDLHTPFVPCRVDGESVTEWVFEDVAHIAQPAFPGLYHFIDELVAMDDRRLVGVQFWNPPPSPTPYVRPAAEIRAEIEQAKRHYGLSLKLEGYIAGLIFALTPPHPGPPPMTDPRFTPVIAPAQASHHRYYPYGPFVSITLAQWAVESAYGTAMSGKNNPFGIKATRTEIAVGEATKVWTKEFINGQYVTEDLYFRDYITMEQAFNAHAKLLISHHYLPCMRAQTPEAYATALHTCGYATAPNYAEVLISVMHTNDLYQFDQRF